MYKRAHALVRACVCDRQRGMHVFSSDYNYLCLCVIHSVCGCAIERERIFISKCYVLHRKCTLCVFVVKGEGEAVNKTKQNKMCLHFWVFVACVCV